MHVAVSSIMGYGQAIRVEDDANGLKLWITKNDTGTKMSRLSISIDCADFI